MSHHQHTDGWRDWRPRAAKGTDDWRDKHRSGRTEPGAPDKRAKQGRHGRDTAPGRAVTSRPTAGRRAGNARTIRRRLGMKVDTNPSLTTPPPTRVADRRARDPARPLGRSGRAGAACPPRHHESSDTEPTCRRLGPRRRIGRPLDPTRTTERADPDDGSEAGNRADKHEESQRCIEEASCDVAGE